MASITQLVSVADPADPSHAIKPNADGSINVSGSIVVTSEATAEATAAAPTYSEGQDAPLSQNLSGDLRTIAKQGTSPWVVTQTSAKASSVSLTRTNDTNAYIANDVIGSATGSTAALTFANFGPTGGGDVLITSVSLEIDVTSVPSGMTSLNLALYSVTPPSAYGDNTAWDLPSGDRASYLGTISLGTPVDVGSTLFISTDQVQRQITLAGTSVFGYLITVAGFTPAASTVFVVKLHGVAL